MQKTKMKYINKFMFVFLVIVCCIDVRFASKVENFEHFLQLDYSDKHVEELLRLSNTKEILNRFLRFVKFEDDAKKKQKPSKQSKDLNEELDQNSDTCLSEIITNNLRTILKTKSGKYLILRLTHLLNKKKYSPFFS